MITIQPVSTPTDLETFIRFPWRIYQDDLYWVPPLLSRQRKRLDPDRNPFYQYAEQRAFLAYRENTVVGTVAAIINHQHNQQLDQRIGYFGFFETINDVEIAYQLLSAACDWLAQRGMAHVRGPVNGAPTDEVGVLLSGFDTHPVMWVGHNPPYYRTLIEGFGFHKYDDVFAYEITDDMFASQPNRFPPKLLRVAELAQARTKATLREINLNRWDAEIEWAHHIYNTAFRTIEGHTDMGLDKFRNLAEEVRPLLDPKLALVAEVDGTPVGFALALPDANEALRHFDGRISRWGKIKLWWRLKRARTACFKLLGVLPEYRGRGLEALLIRGVGKALRRGGYERVDMSLASEKNEAINRVIQRMGGRIYRRYRIYEMDLSLRFPAGI